MAQLTTAACLLYPLLLHACIWTHHLQFAVYYLAVLLVLPMLTGALSRHRVDATSILCAAFSVTLITMQKPYELLLVKLLPFAIHLALFVLFASSLHSGRTPIIERIARVLRPAPTAIETAYMRSVTVAWATFFLAMAISSGMFAILASDAVWSWFVNVISYILVAMMFALEFVCRRYVLGDRVDYSFIEFLRSLMRSDVRRIF